LIFCAILPGGAVRFAGGTRFELAGSVHRLLLGLVRGGIAAFTRFLGPGQGRLWWDADREDDIRRRLGPRSPLASGTLRLRCRFLSADETCQPVQYSPDEPGNLAGSIACHHSSLLPKSTKIRCMVPLTTFRCKTHARVTDPA
jgi:hypothetical protein